MVSLRRTGVRRPGVRRTGVRRPGNPSGDRAGLEVRGAVVTFGDQVAVDAVDLSVADGETLAILGPSGCGKSTLLRAIAGLEPLTRGTVTFDGIDQRTIPVHRRGFGLMFQDGQLFEHMSVGANVAYGLRRSQAWRDKSVRRPGPLRAETVDRLLRLVDLEGYADRAPATLSGGQQQRVALARALAPKPRLLLLDEPLSALDRVLRERLAGDLRRILQETRTSSLLVTHDHEEAFSVADRVAIMRAGEIIQSGTPREVWSAPVDADTALFLGYAVVVEAGASSTLVGVLPEAQIRSVALRRNALRQSADGEIRGIVLSVAPSVDETRLEVRLPDGLVVPAVAPSTHRVSVDDEIRLVLDPTATALL